MYIGYDNTKYLVWTIYVQVQHSRGLNEGQNLGNVKKE